MIHTFQKNVREKRTVETIGDADEKSSGKPRKKRFLPRIRSVSRSSGAEFPYLFSVYCFNSFGIRLKKEKSGCRLQDNYFFFSLNSTIFHKEIAP